MDSDFFKRKRQRRIREKASAAALACCINCSSEKVGDSIGSELPCKTRTIKKYVSRFDTDDQGVYPVLNAQFRLRFDAYRGQVLMSLNPPSPLRFNLDHVPGMKEERRDFVMASSNGLLLLCCHGVFYQNHSQNQYYICNPITKQWLALPPPPRVYGKTNVYFGFIFHPCEACFDTNHDLMRCTNCSCMVVQFPQTTKSEELLQVHVYASSETSKGEWSSVAVQSPKPFCWGTTSSSERAVVHNDCLYWRTQDAGYVVYDPYKNKIHGFINGPPQWQMCARHYEKHRLFTSRDSLWLAQYSPLSGFLRIWELKNLNNDNASGGNLKLDDCYWSRHWLSHFDWTPEEGRPPDDDDVVAIHPFNPDIVFMQVDGGNYYNSFTQCNLRRKSLFQLLRFSHRTSAADIHTLIFPHRRPPPTTSRMVERQMKEPESL